MSTICADPETKGIWKSLEASSARWKPEDEDGGGTLLLHHQMMRDTCEGCLVHPPPFDHFISRHSLVESTALIQDNTPNRTKPCPGHAAFTKLINNQDDYTTHTKL